MRNHHGNSDKPTEASPFRLLTANDLAGLGIGDIAYLKPVMIDGRESFAIHSADGQPLGSAPGRAAAVAAAIQHNLVPLSVH